MNRERGCSLIVSELVTNAIRYGGEGPFQLRMVLDKTCEVSEINERSRACTGRG